MESFKLVLAVWLLFNLVAGVVSLFITTRTLAYTNVKDQGLGFVLLLSPAIISLKLFFMLLNHLDKKRFQARLKKAKRPLPKLVVALDFSSLPSKEKWLHPLLDVDARLFLNNFVSQVVARKSSLRVPLDKKDGLLGIMVTAAWQKYGGEENKLHWVSREELFKGASAVVALGLTSEEINEISNKKLKCFYIKTGEEESSPEGAKVYLDNPGECWAKIMRDIAEGKV